MTDLLLKSSNFKFETLMAGSSEAMGFICATLLCAVIRLGFCKHYANAVLVHRKGAFNPLNRLFACVVHQ